jgi:hypothetical protein
VPVTSAAAGSPLDTYRERISLRRILASAAGFAVRNHRGELAIAQGNASVA